MNSKANPHIHVSCAIIEREGLVLAARRSEAMSMPLKWEFPGGKIRKGESPEDGLRREILEELGVHIDILQALSPSTYPYPSLTVTLYPFICVMGSGDMQLHEHEAVIWLKPHELGSLDWAEADVPVLESYVRSLV